MTPIIWTGVICFILYSTVAALVFKWLLKEMDEKGFAMKLAAFLTSLVWLWVVLSVVAMNLLRAAYMSYKVWRAK